MRYLSVCSGIEAATMAWHPLGWQPVGFSEIEAFPSSVLAHHYPHVPNFGDMTKFKEWKHDAIDLLVGGTPCQSFSVAGLRKGMADPRGNLALTYLAIAEHNRPRWIVWENVPGVLSSNGGRDFGSFLGGLGQLGYGFAYRVLDAQFVRTCGKPFAVPQRRRRVFVVGYLGDWRRAAAVLFDRESLSGHPAPRREAGQGAAGRVARSLACRGRDGTPQIEMGDEVANTILTPNGGRAGIGVGAVITSTGNVAHCLNAGGMGRQDYETETMVAHSLRGEGFDASEDGTGRGTPLVPVGVTIHGTDGTVSVASFTDVAGALRARTPGSQENSSTTVIYQPSPWAVRRLTPKECARLQGFPDDHTAVPYRGKPAADGPQYKAIGNSMAVNVMAYIGERIQLVEDMQ